LVSAEAEEAANFNADGGTKGIDSVGNSIVFLPFSQIPIVREGIPGS
jgi:hypothetical protein